MFKLHPNWITIANIFKLIHQKQTLEYIARYITAQMWKLFVYSFYFWHLSALLFASRNESNRSVSDQRFIESLRRKE